MKNKKIVYISFSLCVISAFVIFLSSKVFADNEYVLTFTAASNHTMSNDNGNLLVDGQIVEVRDTTSNHNVIAGTVACNNDNSECTITIEDGTPGTLAYFSDNRFTMYVSGHPVSFDQVISANESYYVQDYEEPNNNPGGNNPGNDPVEPGPVGPQFDGNAYLIWSCGTGICYKHFNNIPDFDDGNSYYIKDTTIEADNNPGQKFNLDAQYKGWSTDDRFNSWVTAYKTYKNINGDIDWTTVNPADMIGDPIDMREYEDQAVEAGACTRNEPQDVFEACVDQYVAGLGIVWTSRAQLQPLGEPDYNNAYVSYGDRNFKIVVYNSNYKGIAMGSLDQLSYYPAEWTNQFLKRDQFDISGTTAARPTTLDSILLESDVRIKEIAVNNFHIASIEALDVPEGAVTISKDNQTNDWILSFSSHFYDNVTFKVTDSNNQVSYFLIKRYTVDARIKFQDNKPVLNADFYFDRTKSYQDFDMTAVIEYRDGTEKTVTLNPVKGIDDGLGNVTDAWEVDEQLGDPNNPDIPKGKGLKKACFQFQLNDGEGRGIKRAYINIEYKGSTSTNYAGNYAGSGKGTLANIYNPEEDV